MDEKSESINDGDACMSDSEMDGNDGKVFW